MMAFLSRLHFAIKYGTRKRVALHPSQEGKIVLYHKGKIIELARQCPHQGAPLEKGYFKGDFLVCPWHGCRFPLLRQSSPEPYLPTR